VRVVARAGRRRRPGQSERVELGIECRLVRLGERKLGLFAGHVELRVFELRLRDFE
jgi:hypothetical protein